MTFGGEVALRTQVSKRLASAEGACTQSDDTFRQRQCPECRAVEERAAAYRGDVCTEMHTFHAGTGCKRAILNRIDGIGNRHSCQVAAISECPPAYDANWVALKTRWNRQFARRRFVYCASLNNFAARNGIVSVADYFDINIWMFYRTSIQYLVFPDKTVSIRNGPRLSKEDPMCIVCCIICRGRVDRHGLATFNFREPTEEYAAVTADVIQVSDNVSFTYGAHSWRSAGYAVQIERHGVTWLRRRVCDAHSTPSAAFGKPPNLSNASPTCRTCSDINSHNIPVKLKRHITRGRSHRRTAKIDIVQRLAVAERITPDRVDIALHDNRLKRRAAKERMVADIRNACWKRQVSQRRTVEECDVADGLYVLAPVDRLQRRAVVEEPIVVPHGKRGALGIVSIGSRVARRIRNAGESLHRVAECNRHQIRTPREDRLLQFRLKFILVRRHCHRRQRLVATRKATVAQVLYRVGQREVLEVHAVLERLLSYLGHFRAERHLRQIGKRAERHAPDTRDAVANLHVRKAGASEERMVADVRHRVRYLHALQRGTVEERDVADGLYVRAPVDRLQRSAAVK